MSEQVNGSQLSTFLFGPREHLYLCMSCGARNNIPASTFSLSLSFRGRTECSSAFRFPLEMEATLPVPRWVLNPEEGRHFNPVWPIASPHFFPFPSSLSHMGWKRQALCVFWLVKCFSISHSRLWPFAGTTIWTGGKEKSSFSDNIPPEAFPKYLSSHYECQNTDLVKLFPK